MRVIIKNSYADCSEWAALYIAETILHFAPTARRPFVLGLPTGSTPLGTYKKLIELYEQKKISFKNVVTFNMDEYVGLPTTHPESYHYFMQENFFKHIDIKKENTHLLNGMAKDPEKECDAYEKAIEQSGGIQLFLGGVGADGHIAFNEPGSSLASRTRIKTLTSETIAANARFFGGNINEVPKTALTVGVGTICSAQEVLIIANGYAKAAAIAHAVESPVSQMWPVSALQLHRKAVIVCDTEATDELKVGTVRYFNDIESRIAPPTV